MSTGNVQFTVETRIAKVDAMRHMAFGVVLEPRGPDNPDTQGDWHLEADVEKACHTFGDNVFKGVGFSDFMHDGTTVVGWPRESFIAPVDYQLGDQWVTKGSWVVGMYYPDDAIWARIVKGELNAFSVGGHGTRIYDEVPA